ncbi:hypothetical protein PJ985_01165 [Streptomyces sp. ACA25]|uniref:hypothetical protein n=1 Tax=Streptomyces sp. ACA25 TaxID=3022596 RepID=UPI002307A864|nr:hypothetical protein [Streptomyces sp. ACA25]MDB1086183.1 hypothetical protein [Streptomyces sp. ACA25]
MRAGPGLRLLRAAVFAAACVVLAAAGHTFAAGPGVPPGSLAAGWLLVFLVTSVLAGRERRSLPAIAAFLTAAQLALHTLFGLGRTGHGGPAQETTDTLLCHGHAAGLSNADAARLGHDAGLGPAGGHLTGTGESLASLADGSMLLGHLLAALAAGWLLRRGEAALWQLVRLSARSAPRALIPPVLRRALLLTRALSSPLLLVPVAGPQPGTGHHRPTPVTQGTMLPDSVIRRGPPQRAEQLILAA